MAHQQTKQIADQLARTAGHVTSIKRMAEEGRSCPDVLIQLSAVRAAIERAARLVFEDHLESCLHLAVEAGTAEQEWQNLKRALDTFIQ